MIEEKSRRIRHALDSVVVQHETADLVGCAKPVLHPTHHAKRRRLVALEVQHHIDEVLEQVTDEDGAWVPPDVSAGDAPVGRFRRGEDPAETV